MNQFTISFSHEGISYTGVVFPKMEKETLYYTIQLENQKRDDVPEVVATPPVSERDYWEFKSPDEAELPVRFGRHFLDKISEAIEKSDKDLDA